MKVLPTIVDSASSLVSLGENVPDGMLIKEQGSTRFKIGNGKMKWTQLKYVDQGSLPSSDDDFTTKRYVDLLTYSIPSVGSLLLVYGNVAPNGYLLCNGSEFNQARYPKLYSMLGTNVTPNYIDDAPMANTN